MLQNAGKTVITVIASSCQVKLVLYKSASIAAQGDVAKHANTVVAGSCQVRLVMIANIAAQGDVTKHANTVVAATLGDVVVHVNKMVVNSCLSKLARNAMWVNVCAVVQLPARGAIMMT